MSANSRLTLSVHALTWLTRYRDQYEFATSERIADSININAVTLRGLLGMLKQHHLVNVQHGSNAGWQIARDPEEITLLDVYCAVKPGTLFALHHTQPNQQCDIGCSISSTLERVYANAQDVLNQELARTTIADIVRDTMASVALLQRARTL